MKTPVGASERILNVFLQVIRIFNADAEAHQSIVDAAGVAEIGRDAGVRVAEERFDAAEGGLYANWPID